MEEPAPNQQPSTSCWSNIVKNQPSPQPNPTRPRAQSIVESYKSREGISMAVVDANAVIQGGEKLNHLADKFVTVLEVLAEIRDPVSRHRLSFVPFTIESMDPTLESVNKVIKFARATGDLQTLSDVDLKLIALTYMLEAQIHGTKHLRDAPPPVHTVNVRRLPEKDLPGWGSNVPNLEEWEALENENGDGLNSDSRILPLKDISLNIIADDNQSENGSVGTRGESHSENNIDEVDHGLRKHKRYTPKKRELKIEGKKMVADGIDASQGSFDDDNAGDWMPAVSRSTHRRYLRRKARREYYEALSEKDADQEPGNSINNSDVKDSSSSEPLHQSCFGEDAGNEFYEEKETTELKNGEEDVASILNKMRLEECSLEAIQEGIEENTATEGPVFYNAQIDEASSEKNMETIAEADDVNSELEHFEFSSEANGSIDAPFGDGDDSEQSWMLRSLSESSVACVTSDFAMQNVLLQMGLRLVAPGGMQIRQLHRWILKCHACYTVTAEIGRIFCPKCGNGGTLRKVAVTVGENGIVLADRRPRISLRGTKFSLPLPKGGRDAIAKNVILREDQIPQKFLYPKLKKKANKQGDDDFFCSDNIFIHHTDKRSPFRPPVKKAMAVFSGKRNPNDNHYSRAKH